MAESDGDCQYCEISELYVSDLGYTEIMFTLV